LLALLLTAPVQLIGTSLAMVWFPEAGWAKAAFAAAKVLLMLAPLAWLIFVEKRRPRIPRWSNRGMGWAHATGIVIFIAIAAAYGLVGRRWIDAAEMRARVAEMGLDSIWLYLAGTLYWCTINSMLEEYFWRWFIFERLREVFRNTATGVAAAVVVCGLLFMAHHVVALKVYFDWNVTILGSLGCFIGGVTWSWLYLKTGNIYTAYVSHVWADLIIFYLGWRILFG
jgi:membrane protease YdiL (CAAX protease family)